MNAAESVEGRVVIVAGASSGMGRATAHLLAEDGARVLAAARCGDQLQELVSELRDRGLSIVGCTADLRDRNQVARMAMMAMETFGRVDALVYTAGINRPGRAISVLNPQVWDDMIATNLTGAYHCTQLLLPHMLSQRAGLFVYISSLSTQRPDPSGVAYKASKHALKGLADGVNYEHYRDGIRCTVLVPGLTNTPILKERPMPTDPERLAAALRPEDIAVACRFLVGLPKHVRISELVIEPAGLL